MSSFILQCFPQPPFFYYFRKGIHSLTTAISRKKYKTVLSYPNRNSLFITVLPKQHKIKILVKQILNYTALPVPLSNCALQCPFLFQLSLFCTLAFCISILIEPLFSFQHIESVHLKCKKEICPKICHYCGKDFATNQVNGNKIIRFL